jgi:hypothetical protein
MGPTSIFTFFTNNEIRIYVFSRARIFHCRWNSHLTFGPTFEENVILCSTSPGPLTFPSDPRARAGQKLEILARKPRPPPDKNEGLEPGYLDQVSRQNCQHRSALRSIYGFPGAVELPWLSHWWISFFVVCSSLAGRHFSFNFHTTTLKV